MFFYAPYAYIPNGKDENITHEWYTAKFMGRMQQKGMDNQRTLPDLVQKVCEMVACKKDNPVQLLLGSHVRVKSIELIDHVRTVVCDCCVVLLCFPYHCTYRLQLLDVAVMKPSSILYGDEIKNG